MRITYWAIAAAASAATTDALTLNDVCTSSYAQAALPADDFYQGITVNTNSVVVSAVTNTSVSNENMFPDATFDYCAVKFTYTHTGRNDTVEVMYWLPTPDNFQNRFLTTGGGGYAINSGNGSLPGGIIYGAAAGITDGGFGGFSTNFDTVFLIENGTANWESLFMFGYQGIHEMTVLGQEFTKQFFNMSDTKLYSYYQACSEGGREGWSQVQRYGTQFDGAITGAPAFRFSQQQVQHMYSNIVQQTLNYYSPQCELDKIVNATIAACDALDGKTDGVVSRTDLCKLHFNASSLIGTPYYCAATTASSGMGPMRRQFSAPAAAPAQNGTITAEAIAVTNEIISGLRDSSGKQVYLSYQPAASFADAATAYNTTSDSWGLSINSMGTEFVARFIQLRDASTFATLDNITYDTLKNWMIEGMQKYEDTLQTTWPDLTPFHAAGGKVLHFHGESDNSIPTASSVRYHESVRNIMYPNMTYNASTTALNEWYRLFLIPGAAHCSTNTLQPNGPFPQTNLAVLIDWVEKNVVPETLNATVLQGEYKGQNQQICAWPLRPLWSGNGTMECVYDQKSIDTWIYDFDAVKIPVY